MSTAGTTAPRSGHSPLRILVVDDDEFDRLAVRRHLKASGIAIEVEEAATAAAALERIGLESYDCILLDYYLPGVDGASLLHDMRRAARELPVVMLTGRGDEEIAVELMKAGAADYLPKAALTTERLGSSIRHAMELADSVAARRRAEEDREKLLVLEREARDAAEHAVRVRDAMLGVVAHDLRNPVNTIILASSTLLELPLDETSRSRTLSTIHRSAQTMDNLIQDLLDVTRIEAGSFAVKHGRVDISRLLDETRELFEPQARPRDISISCEVASGLTPATGDHQRLAQVLSNIVGNALNFTGQHGYVALRAAPADSFVEISVEDSGSGIPSEQLSQVFDRFWQANPTNGKGSGLGLSIAKGIIEEHGGRIWVESEPGHGTTFRFTVPREPEHQSTDRGAPETGVA